MRWFLSASSRVRAQWSRFKPGLDSLLVCAAALACGAVVPLMGGNWLEGSLGLPALYHLRGVRPAPAQVVIVALDTTSAKALGFLPQPDTWPRSLHAQLITALKRSDAQVIGLDLLFEKPRDATQDAKLAHAIQAAGNVVLVEGVQREWVQDGSGRTVAVLDKQLQSLPDLRRGALASAPFMLPKSAAGVADYWLTPALAGGKHSLPVVMASVMRSHAPHAMRAYLSHSEYGLLNLYGPAGTIRTLFYDQALKILQDPVAARQAFSGRAVLIGLSEFNQSAQRDAYRTPFSGDDGLDISGVELGATALANLLEDSAMLRLPGWLDMSIQIMLAAIFALLWLGTRSGLALLWSLSLALVYVALACLLFSAYAIWVPLIGPALLTPTIICLAGFYRGHRRHIKRYALLSDTFARYLPRQVINRLSGELAHSGDSTIFAVCMCSDIEAYSGLSEKLAPEDLRNMLNKYFALFMPVVEKHGGQTVDIVGDAVMSIWVSSGNDGVCSAALAASRELHHILNQQPQDGALPTRFGLHFGEIFFGEVGASEHREIRVVGDIVNTASRIQSVNKWLGTRVLASCQVVPAGDTDCLPLGRFRLAGKSEVIDLCAVENLNLADAVRTDFARALTAFDEDDLLLARRKFADTIAHAPDFGPAHAHLKYCIEAQEQPDSIRKETAGIFILHSK